MHEARYFLPDHPQLRDVYSREELRAMLLSGRLKRSDIIVDDLTGHGHLLGDFLTWPDVKPFEPETPSAPEPTPSPPPPAPAKERVSVVMTHASPPPLPGAKAPAYVEFRASTPLTASRHSFSDDGEDEPSNDAFNPDDEDEEEDSEEPCDDEDDEWDRHAPHSHDAEEEHDHRNFRALALAEPPDFRSIIGQGDEDEVKVEDKEYLLHHFHPSWLSYPKALVAMLICAVLGYWSYRAKMSLAYPFTAGSCFILCFLNTWLDRSTIDYYITTRRVEAERGLLGRNSDEIRIADIRAIDVQMKGLHGMLGIGAINFSSGGGSLLDVHFRNVRNPHKIKRIVRDLLG